jgi:hypothetical protein
LSDKLLGLENSSVAEERHNGKAYIGFDILQDRWPEDHWK